MSFRHLCISLIALQSAWLAIHVGMSRAGHINIWELGGYGMYSKPYPWITTVWEPPLEDTDGRMFWLVQDEAWKASVGGCLFTLRTSALEDIASEMRLSEMDRVGVAFEEERLSAEKLYIEHVAVSRLDLSRDKDGDITGTVDRCGRVTPVSLPAPSDSARQDHRPAQADDAEIIMPDG